MCSPPATDKDHWSLATGDRITISNDGVKILPEIAIDSCDV